MKNRSSWWVTVYSMPARRGSIIDAKPCAYRFASYFELYRGLLDAFGTERYHLSAEVAHLENRGDEVAVSLTNGQTMTADLVVCADGIRSTGRRILVPQAQPRYAGYLAWRGTIDRDQLSARTADVLRRFVGEQSVVILISRNEYNSAGYIRRMSL